MNKVASLQHKVDDFDRKLLEANVGDVGRYFMELFQQDLGQWERRVLYLLCRSNAYKENNLAKLLELAYDLRSVHLAQVDFVEKYLNELFLPKAVETEKEEIAFLNMGIIPYLTRLIEKSD